MEKVTKEASSLEVTLETDVTGDVVGYINRV